jgi:sugar lactone lactonase YvrE
MSAGSWFEAGCQVRFSKVGPFVCRHAESPVWCEKQNCFYFVDIGTGVTYRYYQDGQSEIYYSSTAVSSVCLTSSLNVLISSWNELTICPSQTRFSAPSLPLGVRFNEARPDLIGRYWVTTMDLQESSPVGALYSYSPADGWQHVIDGLVVGNGIGWSVDNRKMYLTDSGRGEIYQFDFDLPSGSLTNRRLFVKVPAEYGVPDGLVVDSADCVWSAHFNGARVTRYLPTGAIDLSLNLPLRSPTSICFGGPSLSDLFVTSSVSGSAEPRPLDGSI